MVNKKLPEKTNLVSITPDDYDFIIMLIGILYLDPDCIFNMNTFRYLFPRGMHNECLYK